MNSVLAELVRISRIAGADKSFVLGSFGNTSVKTADGKFMYIKASGTALKDMTRRQGWRKLKLEAVRNILTDKSIATARPQKLKLMAKALIAACDDPLCRSSSEAGKSRATSYPSSLKLRRAGESLHRTPHGGVTSKPSVESCFHSILGRYVIHLHPAAVLAYACTKKGREKIAGLFKNRKVHPIWIPYANPGFELARKIERVVENYKTKSGGGPQVLVLQNHGLVVSAETSKDAMTLVQKVVDTCGQTFNKVRNISVKPPCSRTVAQAASMIKDVLNDFTEQSVHIGHFFNRNIAAVLTNKNAKRICSGSAITPDELIYANGPALYLEKIDTEELANLLKRRFRQNKRLPKAFLVKSLGLFVAEQKSTVGFVKNVVEMYLKVRSFSQVLGGICPLSKNSCDSIIRNYG